MPLLQTKKIVKRFGGLIAVDNISFHVDKGEIVGIIGPNGAGKTTIYNMITGIYAVDSGKIIFNGQDITNLEPQAIVECGVSRTFQNIRLFKNLRVIENVLLGTHIKTNYGFWDAIFRTRRYRCEELKSTRRAVEIIKSIGLGEQLDNYAVNLPYGQQRRLEIARAIATDAKIILLDEPAAGMNEQESKELVDFIYRLRDRGHTLLLIEHDMNVVMEISDRVYVVDYGKKIAEGTPRDIACNPKVIRAYLGGGVTA